MKSVKSCFRCWTLILLVCAALNAQQAATVSTTAVVPRLVNFSGKATDPQGKPISGIAGIAFSIYNEQYEGTPLWTEIQNVSADAKGNYTVQLGAASAQGLPLDLFSSGEGRWLGVRVNNGEEQPRVLLLSVPYALKAADAETIGGLPPSAFMLAASPASSSGISASAASSAPSSLPSSLPALGGTGTTDYVPLWTNSTTLGNSVLFQSGTGSTAKVGINTTTPASTLDVKGTETVRGLLSLPATGTATTTSGKNSEPLTFAASAYNSSTGTAASQTFQWQAESTNNDTSTASGTLNLLFAQGANKEVETGLQIASNGQVTFATGQTFPGTGNGTITGVTTASGSGLTGGGTSGALNLSLTNACAANQVLQWTGSTWACASAGAGTVTSVGSGSGLTGGPITGSGTLSVATGGITNSMLQNPTWTVAVNSPLSGGGTFSLGGSTSLSLASCGNNQVLEYVSGAWACTTLSAGTITGVTAGTGMTGGGTSGTVTLNLDTTKVPLLVATNTFSGSNTFTGSNTFSGGTTFSGPGTAIVATTTNPIYPAINASDASGSDGTALQGYSQYGTGVVGSGVVGVEGESLNGKGVWGSSDSIGVEGDALNGGVGVIATTDTGSGIWGIANGNGGLAGDFQGNVSVLGTLSKSGGSFKIDHPLDPANKFLYHSFVESPDMMNVYNGNIATDSSGVATVTMPEWFETLNKDFRYQLTVIGQFAQAIVARKIENNQFQIKTSLPNVEVSWQITGVRQDAWANAHRIPVEEEKDEKLKGFYLHPELYGVPAEKQIQWARYPEMMKKLQQTREQMKEKQALTQSAAVPQGSTK